jgi:VWFA-related protein
MGRAARLVVGLIACACGVAGWGLVSSAQQPAPFRATTEVLSVDVVVTGRDGTPVRGLTAEDFVVRHDGDTLDIAGVDEIGLSDAAGVDPPLEKDGARVVARSTALDAGRLMLIVLDDAFMRFEAGVAYRVRRVGEALVDGLGPYDQAAIVTVSGRRRYHVDFTSDRDVLREAIVAFARAAEAPIPREFAARVASDTFRTAVELFAAVPHRRKVVALVSDGTAVAPQVTTGVQVEDEMRAVTDLQQLVDESSEAGVSVYAFDPSSTEHRNVQTRNRLRALAELTGGRAYTGMNHPERGVAQMLSDTTGYYTLRIYSPAPGHAVTPRVTLASRHASAEVRVLRQAGPGGARGGDGHRHARGRPRRAGRVAGAAHGRAHDGRGTSRPLTDDRPGGVDRVGMDGRCGAGNRGGRRRHRACGAADRRAGGLAPARGWPVGTARGHARAARGAVSGSSGGSSRRRGGGGSHGNGRRQRVRIRQRPLTRVRAVTSMRERWLPGIGLTRWPGPGA